MDNRAEEPRLSCGCVIAIMLGLEAAVVLGVLKWLGFI